MEIRTVNAEQLPPGELGVYPLGAIRRLLGSHSITVHNTERIAAGGQLLDVSKTISIHSAIGEAVMSGQGRIRGEDLDYIGLHISPDSPRAAAVAALALKVASGYGYIRLDVTYDGSLEVPPIAAHVSVHQGGHFYSSDNLVFGNPYLPPPQARRILPVDAPEPQLFDNQLYVSANGSNLAHSHIRAAEALATVDDSNPRKTPSDILAMVADSYNLSAAELEVILAAAETQPAILAARSILAIV